LNYPISLSNVSNAMNRLETPSLDAEYDRRAAVAVILRERREDTEVLFIRRAYRENDPWSGQMAFPGGHTDEADASLQDTAIRETAEEIGLDLRARGCPLGLITPARPSVGGKGMLIAPYVFSIEGLFRPRLNHEVVEVVWASCSDMLRGDLETVYNFRREGESFNFPGFDLNEGRVVWGLTYRIMTTLLHSIQQNGDEP